jgi:hypothetical protein
MAPAALHPSEDALAAFGLGTLDDPAATDVAGHLDECAACRRRVAELPADSFVGRLRDAAGPQADTSRPAESKPTGPAARSESAPPPELAAAPEYADIRELGRGGMGVVYLARNTILDRLEVLKVVTRSADRFVREIQAAARLQHPNVVGAYSAQRFGDLLVFAMEYVPGEDLARLVKARGPLPVADACNYAYQAALGLQHAHEQGMVHRDIKPSNLILTRDGDRPVVKILDFGLAKGTSETPVDGGRTAEGAMLGTPDYVAPEQSLDAARADIRSDIYSLGCTLYQLLAGRPPFAGRGLYEVLRAHHATEATRLDALRPDVPDGLAAVVAKMMAKDPARRFATPAAAAAALSPFLQPRTEPQALDRPKRGRWRVAATVAALCLLAVTIAWAGGAFRVKTPDGTIVLEGLPADADVLVDDKVVTVTRNGDRATVTVVRGGPYGLKVRLGDRELRTSDAQVKIGGEPVRVRVEGRPPEPVPIPPAADPFAAGTVWRGTKQYERGAYAGLTVFYELRVYSRDGESFSGQNFDNGPDKNPCAATGTVQGDALSWTEVAQFNPNHKVDMRGTRTGTVLNLTFKGTINEGRATLYRVPQPGEPRPDDFVPIFDGRSLAGWETHPDQPGGWKVNHPYGKLVGAGAAVSHLYTRRDDYHDVHVKVRAMVKDGGNSGVYVRSGFGPAAGREHPDGYEAPIYAGPEAMKTGGLYLPLASKADSPLRPSRPAPAAGEWFDLEIIAIGPTVRVLVNGQETARADGQTARPGGRIALQLHDPKTTVEFASVAVKELSP